MYLGNMQMKLIPILILLSSIFFSCSKSELGRNYYFDSINGDDANYGNSPNSALKSLSSLQKITFKPGDNILLASGQTFYDPLVLKNQRGSSSRPIRISTYGDGLEPSFINATGHLNGLLLENCSFIEVNNLDITADRGGNELERDHQTMRCGVLIKTSRQGVYESLYLGNIKVHDIFYEKKGFQRPIGEVHTANGTQNYGWGIRVISTVEGAYIKGIIIDSSYIENVAHTGIKLTGTRLNKGQSIQDVQISNTKVYKTGGPGIQMSEIKNGHIFGNEVDHSGSNDDSRKWGRGSGLWTWGSTDVLIEKNRFINAKGPGDSAGAHIDFNCKNIVLQYNFSANNAGGFCEILGNNYNCAYRYNISVNDGYRVKGINGAFQEGKILWLSGYNNGIRKGPFNSYFYNNTIFVKEEIEVKVAIDRVSSGVLIANNIFHIEGNSKVVKGDQYNPEKEGEWNVEHVFFGNNLFLHPKSWPGNSQLQDTNPFLGNADFFNAGGLNISDYRPVNAELVKDKGVRIPKLPKDSIGLIYKLNLEYDILGTKINNQPDLGAIEIK